MSFTNSIITQLTPSMLNIKFHNIQVLLQCKNKQLTDLPLYDLNNLLATVISLLLTPKVIILLCQTSHAQKCSWWSNLFINYQQQLFLLVPSLNSRTNWKVPHFFQDSTSSYLLLIFPQPYFPFYIQIIHFFHFSIMKSSLKPEFQIVVP